MDMNREKNGKGKKEYKLFNRGAAVIVTDNISSANVNSSVRKLVGKVGYVMGSRYNEHERCDMYSVRFCDVKFGGRKIYFQKWMCQEELKRQNIVSVPSALVVAVAKDEGAAQLHTGKIIMRHQESNMHPKEGEVWLWKIRVELERKVIAFPVCEIKDGHMFKSRLIDETMEVEVERFQYNSKKNGDEVKYHLVSETHQPEDFERDDLIPGYTALGNDERDALKEYRAALNKEAEYAAALEQKKKEEAVAAKEETLEREKEEKLAYEQREAEKTAEKVKKALQ